MLYQRNELLCAVQNMALHVYCKFDSISNYIYNRNSDYEKANCATTEQRYN